MDKFFGFLSDLFLRLSLSIPIGYLGVWNLSSEGMRWWRTETILQTWLAYPIGILAIGCSLALLFKIQIRIASTIIVALMVGAILEQLKYGFSARHGGYEAHLVYGLVALSMALKKN